MLANVKHGHLVYLFTEEKSWLACEFWVTSPISGWSQSSWTNSDERTLTPRTDMRPNTQASDAANLITSSTWRFTFSHPVTHTHTLTHSRTRAPAGSGATQTPWHSSLEQGPKQHLLPGKTTYTHTCTLVFLTASQALLKWIPCPPSLIKWPLFHLFVLSLSAQPSSCNYFISAVCLLLLQHVAYSLISCLSLLVLVLQLNFYCWNPRRIIARIPSSQEVFKL